MVSAEAPARNAQAIEVEGDTSACHEVVAPPLDISSAHLITPRMILRRH